MKIGTIILVVLVIAAAGIFSYFYIGGDDEQTQSTAITATTSDDKQLCATAERSLEKVEEVKLENCGDQAVRMHVMSGKNRRKAKLYEPDTERTLTLKNAGAVRISLSTPEGKPLGMVMTLETPRDSSE